MATARWTTVDDIPYDEFGRSGGIQRGRQITFRELESGREGIVWVPLNQYTVDNVATVIQPLADEILAVARIGA